MRNLLQETIEVLSQHKKRPKDVLFISVAHYNDKNQPTSYYSDWDNFSKIADGIYDDDFGSTEVNEYLEIVGQSFWLERHQYDGSEWWEYKKLPKRPNECREISVKDIFPKTRQS